MNDTALPQQLSTTQRMLVLIAAFLGWMFAGLEMAIFPLAARDLVAGLLGDTVPADELEVLVQQWYAWYLCAFLLGAAAGGLLFGWLGDKIGRVKAMGSSILCYSLLTGVNYFITTPEQLLVLRFFACLGVGGMWPNGVALVAEAWSDVSRPLLAGLIGTAANVGMVLTGFIGKMKDISPDDWRWIMLVGALPAILGVFVFLCVAESPKWLMTRNQSKEKSSTPIAEVFRPPLLSYTIIGILLGTIPLLGAWGSANWIVPWAAMAGAAIDDPGLKATTQIYRSTGGTIGSLIGGWVANLFGRRTTYFFISLGSLLCAAYIFRVLTPTDDSFLLWVFVMGFVGTLYFGWLPLYLPELFPTRVRSTGGGVSFNFGRILTVVGIFAAAELRRIYPGDYGKIGSITSLVFAAGMIVILFAPDTSKKNLDED